MKTLLITVLLTLSSCASIKSNLRFDPEKIKVKTTSNKQSVTLRVFTYHDLHFHNLRTSFTHNKKEEKLMLDWIIKTKKFSNVYIERFVADSLVFERKDKKDKVDEIKKVLSTFSSAHNSDLYINIYSKYSQKGPHDGQYKLFWGILHTMSLGFLPMWSTAKTNMIIEVYNNKRELIFSNEIANSIDSFAWTPALLWGAKFRFPNKDYEILREGSMKMLLNKVEVPK